MVDLNIDYVEELAIRFLPLETWGFVESTRTESLLIYNSQWCRLRFNILTDWHSKYLILGYGRLYAVDDQPTMMWKGEDCYCWLDSSRNLTIFLQFLDGITPEEAYRTSQEPLMLSKDFETSLLASHPGINSLELECIRHAKIWEHYGLRFFEVFDLRRSDLWDKYISFLEEYFRLYYEKLDAKLAQRGQTRTPHVIPPYRRC